MIQKWKKKDRENHRKRVVLKLHISTEKNRKSRKAQEEEEVSDLSNDEEQKATPKFKEERSDPWQNSYFW